MKIIKAEIEWMFGWANQPRLKITVDKLPKNKDLEYWAEEQGRGTAYLAEKDGYVSYFWHNPRQERGYSGREFELNLKDGTKRTIKGPWSSRSGVMNRIFATQSVEATIYDKSSGFTCGIAGAVTLELFDKCLAELGVEWVVEHSDSDTCYRILGKETAFDKEVDLLLEKAEDRGQTFEGHGAGKAGPDDLITYCTEIAAEEEITQAILKEAIARIEHSPAN